MLLWFLIEGQRCQSLPIDSESVTSNISVRMPVIPTKCNKMTAAQVCATENKGMGMLPETDCDDTNGLHFLLHNL